MGVDDNRPDFETAAGKCRGKTANPNDDNLHSRLECRSKAAAIWVAEFIGGSSFLARPETGPGQAQLWATLSGTGSHRAGNQPPGR